jgi:hypothetical protein
MRHRRTLRRRYGAAQFIGPRRMTLAEAKNELRTIDVTLSKKDGEYRVNLRGAGEGPAYYTNDLQDAVATGHSMRHSMR